MRNVVVTCACLAAALLVCPYQASAQFNGFNTRGDYGLQSASQPPPGWYLIAPTYVRYDTGVFKDGNGDAFLPDRRDSVVVEAFVLGLIWVSEFKIFGANYSFQIYPAWTDNSLDIPLLRLDQSTGIGFADLYFQPINLGWHTKRADFTAGLGLYAPTGRYEFLADDNLGLGMWGYEIFGGATVFFDKEQTWHFAATAFYETHSGKEDTAIKVGDVLTVEGGLGWSFLGGAGMVGVAYFGHWKMTDDDLGEVGDIIDLLPFEFPIGRNRVYGAGLELQFPITAKKKLIALLNARYLWEFGARTSLEGHSFIFTATFPIPSVPLQ